MSFAGFGTEGMLDSLRVTVARLHKFLHYDLWEPLNDGRQVFEPQKDWAVLVECTSSLNGMALVLPDGQRTLIKEMVGHLQSNFDDLLALLRQTVQSLSSDKEVEGDPRLFLLNRHVRKIQMDFERDATLLRDAIRETSEAPSFLPPSINRSLEMFQQEHDRATNAFIMMRFSRSRLHAEITGAVRDALKPFDILALRADDKEYHDELFPNVQTYMHGCTFGIAIFERIEEEEFNPNVALEVGYMSALGKPVLLLKDRTLKILQADLAGKLYRVFDSTEAARTIPPEVTKWMSDKSLAPS
jgi:hypothetical protein